MMRPRTAPLLPPRGIFVSTRLMFDHELVPHLKITLLQLMSIAWRSPDHTTPKLNYSVLVNTLAKDERTIRGHLTLLRSYHAALRLRYAEPGQFYIILADWLYANDGPRAGVNTPEYPADGLPAESAPADVEDCSRIPLPDQLRINQNQEEEEERLNNDLLLNVNDQVLDHYPLDQERTVDAGWMAQGEGGQEGAEEEVDFTVPGKLRERLLERGLFPTLLDEVAARAARDTYTVDELNALLDWSIADEPQFPAALFMGRLRKGARAPEQYQNPACPRCGQRGKHAAGCPRGYSADF